MGRVLTRRAEFQRSQNLFFWFWKIDFNQSIIRAKVQCSAHQWGVFFSLNMTYMSLSQFRFFLYPLFEILKRWLNVVHKLFWIDFPKPRRGPLWPQQTFHLWRFDGLKFLVCAEWAVNRCGFIKARAPLWRRFTEQILIIPWVFSPWLPLASVRCISFQITIKALVQSV